MDSGYRLFFVTVLTFQLVTANEDTHCQDAECTICVNGRYGPYCSFLCPKHCDSGCDKNYGHCDYQCKLNYTGRFCDELCPPNCREGCSQTSAICHGGCWPTFYGKYCNITCSADCYICNHLSGQCIQQITTPLADKETGKSVCNVSGNIKPNALWIMFCAAILIHGPFHCIHF